MKEVLYVFKFAIFVMLYRLLRQYQQDMLTHLKNIPAGKSQMSARFLGVHGTASSLSVTRLSIHTWDMKQMTGKASELKSFFQKNLNCFAWQEKEKPYNSQGIN
jgi:hypothetical protein